MDPADHRGFELKEHLKQVEWHHDHEEIKWVDVGASQPDPDDDYPDFAAALVEKLNSDSSIKYGVLLCGSGVGVCVAANKFAGIRCGMALSPDQVRAARADDNMNVLAIASDFTNPEAAAVMVEIFLTTEYSMLPKHTRRISKLQEIEKTWNIK